VFGLRLGLRGRRVFNGVPKSACVLIWMCGRKGGLELVWTAWFSSGLVCLHGFLGRYPLFPFQNEFPFVSDSVEIPNRWMAFLSFLYFSGFGNTEGFELAVVRLVD
jgi:hypothetical protein